jgi:hypothetical protein
MSKPAKPWAVMLFSLPFAGIGVGFLVLSIIPTLYEWRQMSDWHVTQATVTSASLQSHQGDDSTTYEATGNYQYRVDGINYNSSRLGISSGADNIGDWHQQMDGTLRNSLREHTPLPVYYNPDQPDQAIVDRQPRWGLLGFKMIFVLTFGGFGVGLLWWSRKNHDKIIDTPLAGEKPWLGHKDWASATIYSGAKMTHYVSWAFALFWNLLSTPLVFALPEELEKGNTAILLGLAFPLVGVWLIVLAIRATRRWRSIGPTPLTLDPYPGSIGGQVGGTIETNIRHQRGHQFPVTLSCLYSYVSGSGKNRSRSEKVKWQAQGFAQVEPMGRGSRLKFCFDVPEDLPESQHKEETYHLWRLNLKSEGLSADLDRNFELPVFSTAENSRLVRVDSSNHPLAQEKRDAQIESVMDMRQIPGGLELFFPRGRNAKMKMAWLVFGIVFFGAGMGASVAGAPLMFPVVFGLFGGGMAVAALYGLLNSLSVRIGRDGVHSRRKLIGLTIRQRSANADDVLQLRIHQGGSATSGTEHSIFYSVKAHLKSGKKITVAESLIGEQAAQQAAEAIAGYGGFELNNVIVEPGAEFAARKKAYQARRK